MPNASIVGRDHQEFVKENHVAIEADHVIARRDVVVIGTWKSLIHGGIVIVAIVKRKRNVNDQDHVIAIALSVNGISVIKNVIVIVRNVSQNSVRVTSRSRRNLSMVSVIKLSLTQD